MSKCKPMKLFNVTFKFRKLPWYELTGIYANNKEEALYVATKQMHIECGIGHKMAKPLVKETSSFYPIDSFGEER